MENAIDKTSMSIPTDFFNEVKTVANENGMSQNAAMMMLMRLGLKLYRAPFSVSVAPESQPSRNQTRERGESLTTNITANFNAILMTEILQAVHKAIDVLNKDCTRFDGQRYEDIFETKIEELKNTVNTFADEELAVYKKLFCNPNSTRK